MNYEKGMVLAFRWESDNYGICKVINVTATKKEPIVSIVTYSDSFESVPENPDLTALKPLVIHMPMLHPAMEASECTQIGSAEVGEQETAAYETWLNAWQERRSGFFTATIPDAVNQIIEAMARVDNGTSDSAFRERLARRWQE